MEIYTEDKGNFKRKDSSYRNWITKDGSAGPTGVGGFAAEKDRYHLYVSYACPWANRTLIMRQLKGLQDMISVSVVNPFIDGQHWNFKAGRGVIGDPLFAAEDLADVYRSFDADFNGYDTVPLLVDKKQKKIVNNESSEIIRMFNDAFNEIGANQRDFYPAAHRSEIDQLNEKIYHQFNNGVYKAGFATSQAAYLKSVKQVFDLLDAMEQRLAAREYLVADRLTEADIRFFVTLIRFDAVYFGHFKCNWQQIKDYQNLAEYTRRLYHIPEINDTIHFDHIKTHYYMSHNTINPTRVVPFGPALDYLKEEYVKS